jgi:hypothetical protein
LTTLDDGFGRRGDRLLLPRILPAKKEKTVCGRVANGLDHSAVLAVLSCVRESK